MESYVERIPHDKLKVTLTSPVEVAIIAENIQRWEPLAPFLGLSDPQVESIKNDYRNHDEQKLALRLL